MAQEVQPISGLPVVTANFSDYLLGWGADRDTFRVLVSGFVGTIQPSLQIASTQISDATVAGEALLTASTVEEQQTLLGLNEYAKLASANFSALSQGGNPVITTATHPPHNNRTALDLIGEFGGEPLWDGQPWPAAANTMRWDGLWQAGHYDKGDVVRDGQWTMVCTNPIGTTDRPSPQLLEPAIFLVPDPPTWTPTSLSIDVLHVGVRVKPSVYGYLTGVRYWDTGLARAAVKFDVYIRLRSTSVDPETVWIITSQPEGSVTGWVYLPLANDLMVSQDSTFDVVRVTHNSASFSDTTLSYQYQKPNNPGIPNPGLIQHANNDQTYIRVSKTDQGAVDRSAFLATVTNGWQILATGVEWNVTEATEGATYWDYKVSPTIQASTVGVQNFIFRHLTPASMDYMVWPGKWNTTSYPSLAIDGFTYIPTTGVLTLNKNAYGIDVEVAKAIVSDDWELVATPGMQGGGLSGGGGQGPQGPPGPPGTTDHSALLNLSADDHPQYLTEDRADLLYAPIGAGGGATADIQTFSTVGTFTWTKPAGAKMVFVEAWGGGGGGGAGKKGTAGTARSGGAGGGGGGYANSWFKATDLGTSETVVIGAGGSGANAVAGDNTNGAQGGAAGSTSFGTVLYARGGFGGAGGSASNSTGGNVGQGSFFTPGTGGASQITGGNVAGNGAIHTGGGGGGGGSIQSNDSILASAAGGRGFTEKASAFAVSGNGPAGGANNTVGGTGTKGDGGGGGGPATAGAAAGAGGAGAQPGGGGGGGGAGIDSSPGPGGNSGAGGVGGPGMMIVVTYF